MEASKQPLSNLQLELLRVFSHDLNEEELKALRKMLVAFFAERAIKGADKVWDEEDWNEEKVNAILNTKLRKTK